jgi:intron-binding protein aquarius
LRDIRRLVVSVSRARLGLYVFCRESVFVQSHELKKTMDLFQQKPTKLQLVLGEAANDEYERKLDDGVTQDRIFTVEDVTHLGSIVHSMQEDILAQNQDNDS